MLAFGTFSFIPLYELLVFWAISTRAILSVGVFPAIRIIKLELGQVLCWAHFSLGPFSIFSTVQITQTGLFVIKIRSLSRWLRGRSKCTYKCIAFWTRHTWNSDTCSQKKPLGISSMDKTEQKGRPTVTCPLIVPNFPINSSLHHNANQLSLSNSHKSRLALKK